VDEFQNFANESFADILSEARKYKLSLTVAHQYIEQMTDEVRAAVFGNVGSMISFRVGSYDAEVLEKEFAPQFMKEDIVNLGRFQMYLRLMIDEVGSQPFSAVGMGPIQLPSKTFVKEIIDNSRAQYAQPRAKVEEDIKNWHNASQVPEKEPKDKEWKDKPKGEWKGEKKDFRTERTDRPEKKFDKPVEKTVERSVSSTAPVERHTEKPAERVGERPAERPVERPAERPTDRPQKPRDDKGEKKLISLLRWLSKNQQKISIES
jgi:hypothetical protein